MNLTVVWPKSDLRHHDDAPLRAAQTTGAAAALQKLKDQPSIEHCNPARALDGLREDHVHAVDAAAKAMAPGPQSQLFR